MNILESVSKLTLAVFVIALAGCASTSQIIEEPSVKLTGVELSDMSFSGQTVLLSFDVSNPNPFPLPVSGVRYHVQLEDESFARGETVGEFSVPAGGEGEFAISVELDVVKSVSSLGSMLKNGIHQPIPYELMGSLAIDLPLVKPVPFSTTGVIKIATD